MPETRTVPGRAFVSPRLMPWREKNVASVTMKLGSRVLVTSQPLSAPTAAAKTRVRTMAGQMGIPALVTSSPRNRPLEPTMTPAERSNSPPIMSSATATATIPIVAAESDHRATPSSEANFPGGSHPPADDVGSAGAGRGQRRNLGRVVLGHEPRTGHHRQATTDRVGVAVVQRQEHDWEVALQVLLLVHREQDLAALDRLHRVTG